MTVVSTCHISSARVVRSPIFGFADARVGGAAASRTFARGGTTSTGRPRLCPAAARAQRACRSARAGTRRGHGLDRPDLGCRQSMRRRARTGRLIVERTYGLPSPGMEPARRQPEELQERPQRNALAGPIDGSREEMAWIASSARAQARTSCITSPSIPRSVPT